ncbi:MAG: UV DNA damage repair endonuclease UvsE [Vallitalea sp.]|jgi:UV DNA damage endonuclease|nr:UV DNA damage repair endonuclease UvsE [Vallitalea sp.]
MRIHIGYVALALGLKKVTSSSTVTYKYYSGLSNNEKLNKLKKVTLSNIQDLEKILDYNVQNDVHFYRLTSALVPLATHPNVTDWNYREMFKVDFEYIGKIIRKHNMRVDFHADQFNVINSINSQVVENTITNLLLLANLFEDMNYNEGKIIIHVGSSQGGKQEAINRFITNFKYFPEEITKRIIIENDDKVFNVIDVLELCNKLDLPMVLDAHHHLCNNEGEDMYNYIDDIFNTWNNDVFIPKVHYSSPKETEFDRRHADYINAKEFNKFIYNMSNVVDRDFDIMLESKKKEMALFKLMDDLKEVNNQLKLVDKTTIKI